MLERYGIFSSLLILTMALGARAAEPPKSMEIQMLECVSPSINAFLTRFSPPANRSGKMIRLDPKLAKKLPPITTLPLGKELAERIRKDPRFNGPEKENGGDGLVFRLNAYNTALTHNYGEFIQSNFVVRTLREIYPKAKFVTTADKADPALGKVIAIDVLDKHETKAFLVSEGEAAAHEVEANQEIDLLKVKGANGGASAISSEKTRQAFGLSAEAKVISLYSQEKSYVSSPALAENLASRKDVRVLFYSAGGRAAHLSNLSEYLTPEMREKFFVIALSKLEPGDLGALEQRLRPSGKKILVYNDVSGALPYLHAAADLSLVLGHVNPYEPMNVGTPTLVFTPVPTRRVDRQAFTIYEQGFAPSMEVVARTGYGARHKSEQEFLSAIPEMMAKGRIPSEQRPYLLASEPGKAAAPYDDYMNHLSDFILPKLPSSAGQKLTYNLAGVYHAGDFVGPAVRGTLGALRYQSGKDNDGIYQIKLEGKADRRLLAKIPAYQEDFHKIAWFNRKLDELGLGPAYHGIVKIAPEGRAAVDAFVTEDTRGTSSKDRQSVQYIKSGKDGTLDQAEAAVKALLDKGILPLDFQFTVSSGGNIKVIDADLYESRQTIRENAALRSGRRRVRDEVRRHIQKMGLGGKSDVVFGKDAYPKLSPAEQKRVNAIRERIKSAAEAWLAEAESASP